MNKYEYILTSIKAIECYTYIDLFSDKEYTEMDPVNAIVIPDGDDLECIGFTSSKGFLFWTWKRLIKT
jgi:hypothetical protein